MSVTRALGRAEPNWFHRRAGSVAGVAGLLFWVAGGGGGGAGGLRGGRGQRAVGEGDGVDPPAEILAELQLIAAVERFEEGGRCADEQAVAVELVDSELTLEVDRAELAGGAQVN